MTLEDTPRLTRRAKQRLAEKMERNALEDEAKRTTPETYALEAKRRFEATKVVSGGEGFTTTSTPAQRPCGPR
ncbi:hypothetical protein J7426_18565 [Tropicibacter sp. R16_0]|uniref:hypothetical protein n=1 Tax=Tropicibacter sp. R16_0 TaxID=2821102 RepID=UPI001ADB1E44|nr:hypothetical protein [Tropicibacter sp. R16_0]MBO9452283.1 hypothetical protein [Tropicibacter sp. R16_0]